MIKKFSNGCVNVMNRFLPDPFLFAVILSIIVYVVAMIATGMGPLAILNAWGNSDGFWGLLSFSMQMALVLVLGSAMASADICKKFLARCAGLAHGKRSAIVVTTVISTICCWLNWGFGLVVGALLAKEVARRVRDVDYRLLIASAYSGFIVWHAGLSGSIPLSLVEGKSFVADGPVYQAMMSESIFHPINLLIASAYSGFIVWHAGLSGSVPLSLVEGKSFVADGPVYQALMSESIFHPINLLIILVVLIVLPLINFSMHPDGEHTIAVDPALLENKETAVYTKDTPAEKMEQSKILWAIVSAAGIVYIVYYFIQQGRKGVSIGNSLNLNIVNFIFLFLGITLHGDLRRYVDAIGKAASSAAGILLQFPFYAGIMGMMTVANENGVSLAYVISEFFVSISNKITYPVFTFLSAGIVNFFVPSGGGQWAVQGPIVMKAATDLGVNYGLSATALAWGDAWTNMIQPFWALPALGIAGLSAKDIMGYLVVVLIVIGLIVCAGLVGWAVLLA